MTARILDGKGLAATLRAETADEVRAFISRYNVLPRLIVILVGNDPASEVYVRNKARACEQAGIQSETVVLPGDVAESELLRLIQECNDNSSVHGILVQLPLPEKICTQRVLDALALEKDVDAFHPHNVGLISQGRPRFLPCTPHGVVELLRRNEISLSGKHAVVVGRSDIVGKPLAAMLAQKGADATVTLCHSRTQVLASYTREADVLIAAAGQPGLIRGDMVKPGAVVVDVGVNRTEKGLCGDVEFEEACKRASAITPVPGGVGPLTIAMLLRNTLLAAKLSVQKNQ